MKPTCHNRFSRIPEDFKEPCMEILATGAGSFMGTLGKFSYVDIEPARTYIEAVNNGRFPISKLSMSSVQDEMGKMIKSCFGKLPEEAFEDTINRLEKKGLIEVDEEEIRLTKLGDMWRYNVCWEFTQQKTDKP